MEDLPYDIKCTLLSILPHEDHVALICTNKAFASLAKNYPTSEHIYRTRCELFLDNQKSVEGSSKYKNLYWSSIKKDEHEDDTYTTQLNFTIAMGLGIWIGVSCWIVFITFLIYVKLL